VGFVTLTQLEHEDGLPPRDEYTRRLEIRRRSLERQTRLDRRIADARLLVFATGLVLLAIALGSQRISWYWSLGPLVLYVALLWVHEKVGRRARRMARAVG
jgi:hypothetical protein